MPRPCLGTAALCRSPYCMGLDLGSLLHYTSTPRSDCRREAIEPSLEQRTIPIGHAEPCLNGTEERDLRL
jgi:hypothetical protein